MTMSRRELDNIVSDMVEMIGAERLIIELTHAMSTHELEDYLGFISRMNDLDLIGSEEEDYYV